MTQHPWLQRPWRDGSVDVFTLKRYWDLVTSSHDCSTILRITTLLLPFLPPSPTIHSDDDHRQQNNKFINMCLLRVCEGCGRQGDFTNIIRDEFSDILASASTDQSTMSAEDLLIRLTDLQTRIRELARPPTTIYLVYFKERGLKEGENKVKNILEKYEAQELDLTPPPVPPPRPKISRAFSAFARFSVESSGTADCAVPAVIPYAPLVSGLTAAHPIEPTIGRFSTEGVAPPGLLERIKELEEVESISKAEWQAIPKSRMEKMRHDSAVVRKDNW